MRKEVIGNCELYCGDYLDIMPTLGKVDAIIADPPYGITAFEWDISIDLPRFWNTLKNIISSNTPIILFAQQPFTIKLINSNTKEYRYTWYWIKNTKCGFLNANKMPMRCVEEILVFYKRLPTYNPKKTGAERYKLKSGVMSRYSNIYGLRINNIRKSKLGLPCNALFFNQIVTGFTGKKRLHPTQKPLELLKYLVKTYSNTGDVILDPFMGSGTTGVACVETGRRFIGIEKNEHYFDISCKRIEADVNK